MALSAFDDKASQPGPDDLTRMLGRSYAHWKAMRAHMVAQYGPVEQLWNFAGSKFGWSLRLKKKGRNLLYMTPCERHFLVGTVLGPRAVKAAHDEGAPDDVLAVIDAARTYAEGTGIRIEVRLKGDLELAKHLAALKMRK